MKPHAGDLSIPNLSFNLKLPGGQNQPILPKDPSASIYLWDVTFSDTSSMSEGNI